MVVDQPQALLEQLAARAAQRQSNLPARPQDLLYHRAMSRHVSQALASYLQGLHSRADDLASAKAGRTK